MRSTAVRWATALACLCQACGGSTDTPRPDSTGAPMIPDYLASPAAAAGGAPLDCSERDDIEVEIFQDFEFGAAAGWYVSNDVCADCLSALDPCAAECFEAQQAPTPFENLPVAEPIPGGRCGSLYAMHIKGGPFVQWGGNLGVGLPLKNVTAVDYVDPVTGETRPGENLHGLTFWARLGDTASNTNLAIQVSEKHTSTEYTGGPDNGPICTPNTTEANSSEGCDAFGAPAQLRSQWQRYVVPFAEMRQAGWGRPAEFFDLQGLMSLTIFYVQGTWDFWIDDLAFYRRKQ